MHLIELLEIISILTVGVLIIKKIKQIGHYDKQIKELKKFKVNDKKTKKESNPKNNSSQRLKKRDSTEPNGTSAPYAPPVLKKETSRKSEFQGKSKTTENKPQKGSQSSGSSFLDELKLKLSARNREKEEGN